MIASVQSATFRGIEPVAVTVEVQVEQTGLSSFDCIGLPEPAVREMHVRVKAAIRNCGFPWPSGRITALIQPPVAQGAAATDLPIAIAILTAYGTIPQETASNKLFVGELSLLGRLRPVRGVMPMASLTSKDGPLSMMVCPSDNAAEAHAASAAPVLGLGTLGEVADFLRGKADFPAYQPPVVLGDIPADDQADFKDVGGQLVARRAMEIAAAGGHNVLMWGEPGAGKTMLARRIPSILPEMAQAERVETTKIYSVAGLLPANTRLLSRRPFRAPHHTASEAAITGGGPWARPGEVSLAHNGVLFLDEMPEFRRSVLEAIARIRQDGESLVDRPRTRYPARFQLVASMSPCPCGYLGSRLRPCVCPDDQIIRYRQRAHPLAGLFPIVVHALAETSVRAKAGEDSSAIRQRVVAAQAVDCETKLSDAASLLLIKRCADRMALSLEAQQNTVAVARTIARLAGSAIIRAEHLAEALSYCDQNLKL